jgi:hypothetical protein
MDYNVEQDAFAARVVWVVQFSVSPEARSREAHLPRLREGGRVEELRLSAKIKDGLLSFPGSPSGKPTRAVTSIDGPRLELEWVEAMGKAGLPLVPGSGPVADRDAAGVVASQGVQQTDAGPHD